MTQDEIIIAMARKACAPNQTFNSDEEWVKRFAAIVAAHERKKCEQEMSLMEEHCAELILIEREACAKESLDMLESLREETIAQCQQGMIEAYKLGQSEEREACANVCEEMWAGGYGPSAITTAIRARTK